jgi:hypothetical protein
MPNSSAGLQAGQDRIGGERTMLSIELSSALCAGFLLLTCGHAMLERPGRPTVEMARSEMQEHVSRVACAIRDADFGHGVVRIARAEADTSRDRTFVAADPSPGDDAADFGTDTKAWKAEWAACINHVGRRLSGHCAAVLAGQGAFASGDTLPRKATADAGVYGSLSNLREDRAVQSSGSSGTCPLCLTPPC